MVAAMQPETAELFDFLNNTATAFNATVAVNLLYTLRLVVPKCQDYLSTIVGGPLSRGPVQLAPCAAPDGDGGNSSAPGPPGPWVVSATGMQHTDVTDEFGAG
jgi:hypothetical protein